MIFITFILVLLVLCSSLVLLASLALFVKVYYVYYQGCIFRLTRSYPELTEDHVLTSAYVKILRTVTRNLVNKHAMNIFI